MNKTHIRVMAGLLGVSVIASGCGKTEDQKTTTTAAVTETTVVETETDVVETTQAIDNLGERPDLPEAPADGMKDLVYEAEDAEFIGNAFAGTDSSCSGGGYADGLFSTGSEEEAADAITFKIEVPYDYYYDLTFLGNSGGSKKYNYVKLDGMEICELCTSGNDYTEATVEHIYMTAGSHDVSLETYWGYVKYDNLTVSLSEELDPSIYEVSANLVNPNADENARRLMKFLTDIYGKFILTGQYSDGFVGMEMQSIYLQTDTRPAICGLDLIEYSPSRVERGSTSQTVENAIDYWERGGIVTLCWHWNAPSKYLTGEWYSGFRAEATNIDLAKIMNGEDEEGYELLMEDIDAIAAQLQRLEDAGVPILWRPLHEASGGWFWWGERGAEPYKKLWILLYDKLTNEYGLDNLIWLWNGQDADWYPGDEYVDIIGEDIYPGKQVDSSQIAKFLQAARYTSGKMVVLSENGCVPDPEKCYLDGAMWGFYCTWGSEFVLKTSSLNRYSENYTTLEVLKKMYESPLSLTMDELPDLKNYPLD